MGKVKEKLENLVGKNVKKAGKRYLPVAGVMTFNTALHEGLHALTAKILPGVSSGGVIMNDKIWYSGILEKISLGFYDAKDFASEKIAENIAGQALVSEPQGFIGNLSYSMTAAIPEVASLTLGLYLIKQGISGIMEKGRNIQSVVYAYAGSVLTSEAFSYARISSTTGMESGDHLNFTKGLLGAFHMPEFLAPYITFAGAGLMVATSLYFAKKLPSLKKEESNTSNFKF